MKKARWEYASKIYYSNCVIEALRAKLRHPLKVTVYFCKPFKNRFHVHEGIHVMWADKDGSYDFSDAWDVENPGEQHPIWYRGQIRKFKPDFARRYSEWRNSQ